LSLALTNAAPPLLLFQLSLLVVVWVSRLSWPPAWMSRVFASTLTAPRVVSPPLRSLTFWASSVVRANVVSELEASRLLYDMPLRCDCAVSA
jgi:hypothetical protein